MNKPVLQILTDGGAGDLCCALIAVNHNIKTNPLIEFQVWCPDYLTKFAQHVLPASTDIRPFSKADKEFDPSLDGRTTQWVKNSSTPMRMHPMIYAYSMLADRFPYNTEDRDYLKVRPEEINIKRFKLPEKYVVIGSTASEPVKELSPETLNEISEFVISRGFKPVYLGKEESQCGFKDFTVQAKVIPVDYFKGINLVNKTSLLEAAAVIAGAKCFVGMDGGLLHLAGFTDTWIVAGFSLVSPQQVAPYRNGSQNYKFLPVEPDPGIANRYFQSNSSAFYQGDCRKFLGWEKVIADLTADKFINELKKIF